MKKFASIFLALVMVMSVFGSFSMAKTEKTAPTGIVRAIAQGLTYENLTYNIENNGTITITRCAQDATGDIVIPATITDPWTGAIPCPVTKIADEAFSMCMNITSVEIPATVTSIGTKAFFGCTAITSLNIPSGLTTLGAYAFNLCKSLKKIAIPATLTAISDYAFKGCSSITNLTIPASVKSIGVESFADCTLLKNVTFKGTVESIGNSAFKNCPGLIAAYFNGLAPSSFGAGVFASSNSAFSMYYLEENTSSWAPNGQTTYSSDAYPLAVYSDSLSGVYDGLQYIVEDTNFVTIIGYDPAKISGTVVIPEKIGGRTVTAVEKFALSSCQTIESVVIPQTITTLGEYSFYGCSSLSSAYFRGNPPVNFGTGVFDDAAPNFTIYYRSENKSAWAPNDEKTYMGYPISYYRNIESGSYGIYNYSVSDQGTITITSVTGEVSGAIEIPSVIRGFPVTTIGATAFAGNTEITSVVIPSSVTSIGMSCFANCEKITSMVIPDSVVSIDASAFANCYALEQLTLGSDVNSLGTFLTFNCTSLKSITVSESNPYFASIDGVAYNKEITKLVLFPTAKDGIFVFPATVSEMASMSGAKISSLTLPAAMTTIPAAAFSNCSNLTSIIFPETVTKIDSSAFSGCTALTTVRLPASLTELGYSTFATCSSLKSAYFLGDKPISSGYFVFNGVADDFIIYYNADCKDTWAPANEDNWYGYPIAPFGASETTLLTPAFGSPYVANAGLLKGVTPETTVADVIATFEDSANIRITDINGNVLSATNVVGTNYKVQLVNNGAVSDELAIVIVGDITGDGKVNSRDLASLQRHITGSTILTGACFVASNVNNDVDNDGNPKVNSRDIAELQRMIAG